MNVRTLSFASMMACAALAGSASGATLFSDNFESAANGGNDTVGSAPVADVGTYTINGVSQTNGIVRAASSANPLGGTFPAASATGGANFLPIQQATDGNRNSGKLSSPANSGTFHYELEFYVTSAGGVGFGFGSEVPGESFSTNGAGSPASTRPKLSFQVRLTAGQVQVYRDPNGTTDGTANPNIRNYFAVSGLSYTANTWQKYSVDYVLGTNSVTLTAGANSATVSGPFPGPTETNPPSSLSQVDTIFAFTISTGAIGYADNLLATGTYVAPAPEPATLVAVGAAGLVAAGRRRRR